MAGSLRLQFFLCALVFMVGIGLIAAIQPAAPRAAPAAAAAATVPPPQYFRHPRHGMAARPWAGTQPGVGPGGVMRPAYRWRHEHWARPRPAFTRASTGDDFTFDGWRLLGALALTGGVASLLWASLGELRPERGRVAAPARLEREVVALRDEVDRLQREQRQLQLALDWQERLLKRTAPEALAAGPASAAPSDDA